MKRAIITLLLITFTFSIVSVNMCFSRGVYNMEREGKILVPVEKSDDIEILLLMLIITLSRISNAAKGQDPSLNLHVPE